VKYDINFASELVSGSWSILSIVMVTICVAYLFHEWRARLLEPERWTIGMSVALGVMTFSIAIFITRIKVFIWRHYYGLSPLSADDITWLVVGGAWGVVGFLMTIRALSLRLYGQWIWISSVGLLAVFIIYDISVH
jgi:hypothetical protein